jgi:hypothetical protein
MALPAQRTCLTGARPTRGEKCRRIWTSMQAGAVLFAGGAISICSSNGLVRQALAILEEQEWNRD